MRRAARASQFEAFEVVEGGEEERWTHSQVCSVGASEEAD